MPDKAAVKCVAGDCDPIRAQDIVMSVSMLTRRRAELDEGEITGPAAEIRDQDQLVMIKLLLILVRRGDRFQLELDVREAALLDCRPQTTQGKVVSGAICRAREMCRSSYHHARAELATLGFCRGFECTDDQRD